MALDDQPCVFQASMRPAQKAPENILACTAASRGSFSFNEAGAKSAGKPAKRRAAAREAALLQ